MARPSRPRLSSQQQALRGQQSQQPQGPLYKIHKGPQLAFMMSSAEELLYGGAAGGGKSLALRAWAVAYCMKYPGALIGLFRRSYRELEDTHILTLQKEVPLSIATYSAGSHNFTFFNGSMIQCRYAEHEEDVRTYETTEWDALLIDEVTHFSEYQYVFLVSRVRSTKPWWPGRRIRCAATPTGIGMPWVKARWVYKGEEPIEPNLVWRAPLDEGGFTRQFIPAKVQDNTTLMRTDPHYIDALRALPEEEYRAKALGDWSIFSGQFFTRWRPEVHTMESFDIPPDWERWLGIDYGFNAPYCALWVARPPNTETAFVYREHYGAGIESNEQIRRAYQVSKDAADKLRGVILDPSLFGHINVKGERVSPISDDWKRAFHPVPVYAANNDRVPGWKLIREMINWTSGPGGTILVPPRLFVFNTCPNLIRTLPALATDKLNPEDVNTKMEDHAPDCIRYLLMHAFRGPGKGGAIRYRMTPQGLVVVRS